jgi:hypothetical protein
MTSVYVVRIDLCLGTFEASVSAESHKDALELVKDVIEHKIRNLEKAEVALDERVGLSTQRLEWETIKYERRY